MPCDVPENYSREIALMKDREDRLTKWEEERRAKLSPEDKFEEDKKRCALQNIIEFKKTVDDAFEIIRRKYYDLYVNLLDPTGKDR